jgi:hypothetical protein
MRNKSDFRHRHAGAVLKPPQSRRWRDYGTTRNFAKSLDYGAFTAAFLESVSIGVHPWLNLFYPFTSPTRQRLAPLAIKAPGPRGGSGNP